MNRSLRMTFALTIGVATACAGDAPPSGPSPLGSGASVAGATMGAPPSAQAGASAQPRASSAAGVAGTSSNGTGAAGVKSMPMGMSAAGAASPMGMAGAGMSTAGTTPTAGAPAAGSPANASSTGTLPVPAALDQLGPYEILDQPDTGPGNQFRLFAPMPLGEDGLKHPVVAWSPGAGAFPDAYLVFLKFLASHGFVTLCYNSTASGTNLVDAIDWLIAENERADSVLYGKLDTTKIAAGGHSAGSLATYEMADDPRLTTTLHMSGGSFEPSTDVPRLKKPALMVCGDAGGDGLTTGDLANPMCIADFEMANVPVFFAVVTGAGHTALNDAEATAGAGTAPDDPHKLLFIKATIGWLRWQLANDESRKAMFVGDDCELCAMGSSYAVQQKNLQ